jgi:hypothetical protein
MKIEGVMLPFSLANPGAQDTSAWVYFPVDTRPAAAPSRLDFIDA